MKTADLHLHTFFSDGTYSPEELVNKAHNQGLSVIAITDHDTVDGIERGIEAGKLSGVEVLPGIELTVEYQAREVHLLGYLIDYQNKDLKQKLEVLNNNRIERIYKITAKLKEQGINLNPEAVFNLAKNGSPGRLHIARAMVAEGIIGSTYEAFRKYIGDKCPSYVAGFKFTPQEGIKLIKNLQGIPVLAHPYSINNDELIPLLVDFGLMGLEVYYSEHTQSMINFYFDMAKKYNLLVTGGSDCHGEAKSEIKIGSVKIPYELVEKLKEAKKSIVHGQ